MKFHYVIVEYVAFWDGQSVEKPGDDAASITWAVSHTCYTHFHPCSSLRYLSLVTPRCRVRFLRLGRPGANE